jgi:class 3 adenylate cyclase
VTYQVFEDDHDSTRLTVPPVQIWVIVTLEISITDGGQTHLLLTFPSYPLDAHPAASAHDEGYWAPPNIAYPVPMTFSPPTSIGSLRRLTTARVSQESIMDDLSHLAYQLGLRDTEFEPRGEFYELKMSPRTPGLMKAYKFIRFGLLLSDEDSVRNLADPDNRRGYVYLPLDDYETMTRLVPSESHARTERWFLGKPLMSNVEHVLDNKRSLNALKASGIPVPRELFSRREKGVLCAVDLAGYGTALRYATENMHSFDEVSTMIQESFRKSVAKYFDRMLATLGAMQVQTAGDGFIAAFPERVFQDKAEALERLFAEWREVTARLDSLNSSIRTPEFRVGSRMALHYGEYEYGRIGGAASFTPAFDGASIIEAARLEQGLAAAMREGAEVVGDDQPLTKHDNNIIVSSAMRAALGESWKPRTSGLRYRGELPLAAKEFRDHAELWAISPREP